jgi:hypothetical protein
MKLLQDSLVTNFSISLVSTAFSALLMLQILGQDFTEILFWLKPPESFGIVFFLSGECFSGSHLGAACCGYQPGLEVCKPSKD